MTNKKIPKPTEAELEILQVLWQHGPSSVRFVNDELNKQRDVGYTSTLKIMQLMLSDKNLVKRDEASRSHIYEAVVKENDIQKALLDKFVDATFRGSAMRMVMQALGNHKASREELDEIKALINKIEKGGES